MDAMREIWAGRHALKTGKFDDARAIAGQILQKNRRNLDALEIKALAEIYSADDVAAEATLRAAISAAPQASWPYAGLSELLMRHRRFPEAEAVSRSALAADPRNADAHDRLGFLLSIRMRSFEAIEHFEQALAIAGPNPVLLTRLGHAILRLGRLEDAREPLEAAIAADPNAHEAATHLSELEERLGNFEAAMQQLDRAERMGRPQGVDLTRQRSLLLARMGKHQEALGLLERKAQLSGAELLQRGRLRERVGRYPEAWNDWQTGKEKLAARGDRRYPSAAVEALARGLARFFASPAAAALPRARQRQDVPQPIFIVGFPRSGTTLTERILASHSKVEAGGELPFGEDLHELAVSLAGGEISFPAGLSRAGPDWTANLRDQYLESAARYGIFESGLPYFTDKMPSNDFWVPLLRLAFPQSPIVHVRRHPLDVLTSVMAHEMTHGFNCGYRLEDAAKHFALADWLLEEYCAAGIGATYRLSYEKLVANQVEEIRRLTEAVGLQMEPAQLNFHESGAVPATPSYVQVREPLNDRSIGQWKKFTREFEQVVPVLQDSMGRGGYET